MALERTSRYLHLTKVPVKTSQSLRSALPRRFSRYPQPLLHSITYDNGDHSRHFAEDSKIENGRAKLLGIGYHALLYKIQKYN
jgi:IS30 family transposase